MRLRLKQQRLQAIIADSPLSQNHWALKMGLSKGHWSEIVNGKHPYPSPKTRARLLDALGVGVEELFEIEAGVEPWADVDFRRAIADRYIIDHELGQGGMGAVYLARDVARGRVVAVKVVAPEMVSGIGVDQFLREIATVAQLTHPNILPLFDSGAAAGHPFYVMPLIRGGSLRGRLRERVRLSVPETLVLLRGIAAGLQHAHDERVLHCDMKPENVLVHGDHAYVMDFGIARKIHTEAFEWSFKQELDLSAGTPAYVSPEQAAGERDLDARSDVYSLGCMVFEMLTGRPPFEGTSTQAIVSRRFIVPPPPVRDLAPEVPAGIASAIERAMALAREQRQSSVAEFLREIDVAAQRRVTAFGRASLTASRATARARRAMRLGAAHPVGRLFSGVGRDLVVAWRGLRRAPTFTSIVALTIGLALGVNATMYGIVDRLMLRPPAHVADPDRVQRVSIARWRPDGAPRPSTSLSYATFTYLRDLTTSLESVAAVHHDEVSLGTGTSARPMNADLVTGQYFAMLGVRAVLGRLITESDDRVGASGHVAVLSYGAWRNGFGALRSITDSSIVINGERYQVIGVAPLDFTGADLRRVDVWVPLSTAALPILHLTTGWPSARNWYFLEVLARLRPAANVATASADVERAYRLGHADAGDRDTKALASMGPMVAARNSSARSSTPRIAVWLWGMAIVVLLVACANVANLVLARGVRRRAEFAVRRALGVSNRRLLRQLLAESALLGGLGSLIGLAVARWGGRILRDSLLPGVSWDQSPVAGRVLAITLVATAFVTTVASLLPLVSVARADVVTGLREAGRGIAGVPRAAFSTLLFVQVALATTLVIGAGLFVTSLNHVRGLDFGFAPQRLLYATLNVGSGDASPEQISALYRDAAARLATTPGIRGAGALIGAPFMNNYAVNVSAPGVDSLPQLPGGGPYYFRVSAGTLEALGTRLVRGRTFTSQDDRAGAPPVVIVTAQTAHAIWPDRDPLTQCLVIGKRPCAPVIGVVADLHRQALREDPFLSLFIPLSSSPDHEIPRALVVRVDGDPARAIALVRQEVLAVEPNLPFISIKPYQDLIDSQARSWSLGATMFTIFGILAMAMAAVGVYGVLTYVVSQRTAEFGIRSALGATPARVMAMIVASGLAAAGVGTGVGLAIAFVAAGKVEPLLFETSARDPMVFAAAATAIVVTALVATVVPGLRAARVNPMWALRAE